jgi:nucleoside-diphosphate-sugar epimerase
MHPYLTPQIRLDMAEIVDRASDDLKTVTDGPLVLTGSTGFVGTWLTLSFLEAKRKLGSRGDLILVSRNPLGQRRLLEEAGYGSGYRTISSDVRLLSPNSVPEGARFIHAATPARASLNNSRPLEMLNIIVDGQKNLLEVAHATGTKGFLFLSSGAVYGKQPVDLEGFNEDWSGAPSVVDPQNAYHEGKRVAELMGNLYQSSLNLPFVTARLFAFLAPFLPLDEHFAAGNFIGDAVVGRDISIQSGGGSIRSYQYGTDMSVWLWAILARGESGHAYNVGSDQSVTILELAQRVTAQSLDGVQVRVKGVDTPKNISRYVPAVHRAKLTLCLENCVQLDEAIHRTLRWNGEL